MTALYLSGAENPTHQELLLSCGVDRFAVNVGSLLRRKVTKWSLELPEGAEWVAYADGAKVTEEDLLAVMERASVPPVYVVGPEEWSGARNYLPVWEGGVELPEGRENGFCIVDRVLNDKSLKRRALAGRSNEAVLGVITGSKADLSKFDFVISAAWWSVQKYGETQLWDGRTLCRYNADMKDEARTRHRRHIAELGLNPDAVIDDDPEEVSRLAIMSWLKYAEKVGMADVLTLRSVDRDDVQVDDVNSTDFAEDGTSLERVDIEGGTGRHDTARDRITLPVLGLDQIRSTVSNPDGSESAEALNIVESVATSFRRCDNCMLASAGCPGYQPGASCAYEIPIELRSKDQLAHVLNSLIEMQVQRIYQARFAEELLGQEASEDVGKEMDRLFAMVKNARDFMDNRETVHMTLEAKGNSGMLSRLFGSNVGASARMLEEPATSDNVIEGVTVDS